MALVGRNANAGIVDVDAQALASTPTTDQNAARSGIFDGVGDEILQQPAQQSPVRPYVERTRHENQIKALVAGERGKVELETAEQLVDPEGCDFRFHSAGVEP